MMNYDTLLASLTLAADSTVDAEAISRWTMTVLDVDVALLPGWQIANLMQACEALTDPTVSHETRLINAITELSY